MIIENARYIQEHETDINVSVTATFNGVEISVPLDPVNRHYAEILRQVEAGDLTIAEAD